jgi:hypothetical protein
MNYQSQPLQRHEIESMKSDPAVVKRVVQSYTMMLDFYGMALLSEESGLVGRSGPPRDFATRYRNLVRECSGRNHLNLHEFTWPWHCRVISQ